jgi:hypothetical protein
VLDDMSRRTGYVGVLVIAFIDGLFTFIVLEILGVPFAVPLAVMMGTFSLIPLVGATIGAVLVGIVTVFADFDRHDRLGDLGDRLAAGEQPAAAADPAAYGAVHPLLVLTSVLFGATLLGVLGALVAIPMQRQSDPVKDWWAFRQNHSGPAAAAPAARDITCRLPAGQMAQRHAADASRPGRRVRRSPGRSRR